MRYFIYSLRMRNILLLLVLVAGRVQAQDLTLRTNVLYDLVVAPSVGVEVGVTPRITIVGNGAYNWIGASIWGDRVHVASIDVEGRYWLNAALNSDYTKTTRCGHHVGAYVGYYRYDMLFNGSGQQAKANFGLGVSYGYSLPVSPTLNLDFTIGLGYVGGEYKKYEVSDDELRHNVWTSDKIRHYFGPSKAEVALVWRPWKK